MKCNLLYKYFVYMLCIPLLLFIFSCDDQRNKTTFRLSKESYSQYKNKIIYIASQLEPVLEGIYLIGIYDFNNNYNTYLDNNIRPRIYDCAWRPNSNSFIITTIDGMIMLEQNQEVNTFSGFSISCPIDVGYTYCTWNEKGNWLAVDCISYKGGISHMLGLFDLENNKVIITDIKIDHKQLIWKNNETLYAIDINKVLEINIGSGEAEIARRIDIGYEPFEFYGFFDNGKPLIQHDHKIKLGGKIMAELDRHLRNAVIITEKYIFIRTSKGLVVCDLNGEIINQVVRKSRINSLATCEDPNTVYGIENSTLLRIKLENNIIQIQEIADLQYLSDRL